MAGFTDSEVRFGRVVYGGPVHAIRPHWNDQNRFATLCNGSSCRKGNEIWFLDTPDMPHCKLRRCQDAIRRAEKGMQS